MPDENRTQPDLIRFMQELITTNRESAEATRELRRSIDDLRSEFNETFVRKEVWLEARKNDADAGLVLSEQVKGLVSLRDWAIKIVVGAVLIALLGLVIVSNGGAPT